MQLSLSRVDLSLYYQHQLNNFFPDKKLVTSDDMNRITATALDRLDHCFKHVAFARYNDDKGTKYNHLYADHNIVLTWLLASTAFKISENSELAAKLYYLNKSLHSFDCMYDTALPDIFLIFHGAGTMLGKAHYSDYFVSLQGCTVGSHKGLYPRFGKGVALTANSSVIGDCELGNRVSISTRACIFSKKIPADHSVYVNWDTGILEMKASKECYAQQFFKTDLSQLDR